MRGEEGEREKEGGVEKPEENQMESVFQSNPTNQQLFLFVLHLFPSTKGNRQFVIEMKSTSQEVTAVKASHLF